MTNTIDKKEIEQFSYLSNTWWDKSGPFSPLHKMSDARIKFIRRNAIRIIENKYSDPHMLKGLNCLDVGCGGGILSEKLSRLGAIVTGIDASDKAIQVAKAHSLKSRLKIDYKCMTTSDLLESDYQNYVNKFDLIIASEIIEHVKNRDIFLSDLSKLCRSGGLVVFTTINDSFLGIMLGKFFAENVIKIIPKGTHDHNKFISPEKLTFEAEKHNIILDNFTGFQPVFSFQSIFKKEFENFKLSSFLEINYGAAGIKV